MEVYACVGGGLLVSGLRCPEGACCGWHSAVFPFDKSDSVLQTPCLGSHCQNCL